MSGEIIAILGVGVARTVQIAQLRERMAHLKGLLEDLRGAITGRATS